MNIAKKGTWSDQDKFRHEVAKEIIRILSACGASYEDVREIFEITTWRMNAQTVQSPDD